MNGFDEQEYNAVILSALLHDIGKFLHRLSEKTYHISHQETSYNFIQKNREKISNKDLYNIDLVEVLVRYHHGDKNKNKKEILADAPYIKDLDTDKKLRVWDLIKIVQRADVYSCYERDHTISKRDRTERRAPLDSIFSNLNLSGEIDNKVPIKRYHLTSPHPLKTFPDDFPLFEEKEFAEFVKQFEDKIIDFSKLTQFDDVLVQWLNILQKFTWAIPSDTRYEQSDVSLYDHLRSSAAIAACLYKHHVPNIGKGRLPTKNEFVFIAGDFSGIQKYIFHITNQGSGGAAKRLRARSLFIALFSDTVIHKIIHTLGLPLLCNLFSAAGKFMIIAPQEEGVDEILKELRREIESHIHRTFFSQFSFLMTWDEIGKYKQKFKVRNFYKTADEMFHHLENQKLNKTLSVFKNENIGTWNPESFKATELYKTYTETGDCPICGRGPAIKVEKDSEDNKEPVKCCSICFMDKYYIGEQLPRKRYVAFGRSQTNGNHDTQKVITLSYDSTHPKKEIYFFELLADLPKPYVKTEYYLFYDMRPDKNDSEAEAIFLPVLEKNVANHIPTNQDGSTLDFGEIAKRTIWKKDDKNFGSPFLGVLKVDIDNLGLLFSKGFETPRNSDEKKLSPDDRKTVSRYLTFSRMVELFMSGWMNSAMTAKNQGAMLDELSKATSQDKNRFDQYLQESKINFEDIYTVYSGGDDLVLVGPWETMIIFSMVLYQQFQRFTCGNPDITLSAGLAFVKPKHPIASAIKEADRLLKISKKEGKNSITLFGTNLKWSSYFNLLKFFLFVNEKLNDENSRINNAFLYNLLEYHDLALKYIYENYVLGLKYISHLSYDIERNITKRNIEGMIIHGLEEYNFLHPLMKEHPSTL